MPLPFAWPDGRRAAVSLTYDDALPVHHEAVAPALEAHGLRGTFYTPINSGLVDDPAAWSRVAAAGHELGNHTIYHPCRQKPDGGRLSLDPDRDLRAYTLERWEREVGLANRILAMIDGRTIRSFGNTCHHTTVGPDDGQASIEPNIFKFFSAARGPRTDQIIDPETCQLESLGCFGADGRAFDQIRPEIDAALERGGWIIYCAHGVGRDHNLLWDAEEHELTIEYLAKRADQLWTAPLNDVAEHIRAWREAHAD